VRVRIPRAINFARDLRFCSADCPAIGKRRAGAMLERDYAKKTQRCALCHRAPLMSSRRGDEVCSASCDATSSEFPVGQPNKMATLNSLSQRCDRGINGITGLIILCVAGMRRDSATIAREKATAEVPMGRLR
jgi:hypothetical protein